MRTIIQLLVSAFFVLAVASPGQAQPVVAASIKPLQLIARAVTDGISEPTLILDATQDPHHPALKPSQRHAMDEAGVFIWIGPQMETGLEQVVGGLQAAVITALDIPGVMLQHVNQTIDPHLWLDTRNVSSIATQLTNILRTRDPDNADRYTENLELFNSALARLAREIRAQFQVAEVPPFAVYHNGYQYFEKQFGLSHITSFTNNEEVQPGIRQVLAIRQELAANQVNCLVVGPSVNTGFLDNQLDRSGMHYVTIDVLAHDIALTRDGYVRFMTSLAAGFDACRP